MTLLLAVAGVAVTVMVVVGMMLLVPGGATPSTAAGAFGQEGVDHGTRRQEPRFPER